MLIDFTWRNSALRPRISWHSQHPEAELLVYWGNKESGRVPGRGSLSPWGPHVPHPQELTARYCGVRPPSPVRFPQVAVLSCCICCASCCWRRLCSLSFWVSANFTTIGEEQPCGQTQRKVKRGVTAGPLGSGHSVSVGPSFLMTAAEGMVLRLLWIAPSTEYYSRVSHWCLWGSGAWKSHFVLVICLLHCLAFSLQGSSFHHPQDLLRDKRPDHWPLIKLHSSFVWKMDLSWCVCLLLCVTRAQRGGDVMGVRVPVFHVFFFF